MPLSCPYVECSNNYKYQNSQTNNISFYLKYSETIDSQTFSSSNMLYLNIYTMINLGILTYHGCFSGTGAGAEVSEMSLPTNKQTI